MRSTIACLLAFGICSAASVPSQAQISSSEARKMGMQTAWKSQVQMPRVGSGIVSSHLRVEPNQPRRYAVVELPEKTIRVSADQLDRDGNPIGLEEAKKQAGEQAARLLGKSSGFQVAEVTVPRIQLVLVTNDGLVQALDAESGQLLWSTSCGNSGAPAHPAAASPLGVVVIHGVSLYLLAWDSGKIIKQQNLRFATANAVAVCNDVAFVSDFTGRVELYGLDIPRKPWGYVLNGRAVGNPVSLADQSLCAVATATGYVYVFIGGEEPGVWIRYDASSPITGCLAAGNGAFYAGDIRGVLAKINVSERLGSIQWEYRSGRTITAAPLVVGGQVIAATESGDAFSIEDATGNATWTQSALGLQAPIATAANRVFFTSSAGSIYALHAETGEVIAKSSELELANPIINSVDDRLYVVTSTGQLQCLQPIGGELPVMITAQQPSEADAEQAPAELEQPSAPATENPFAFGAANAASGLDAMPPATPAAGNPFETGNPFSAGGDDAGGLTNPFGPAPTGDTPIANPFE